jgi:hypothetical protein
MFDFINSTNHLMESVSDYDQWQGILDDFRGNREQALMDYTQKITGTFDSVNAATAMRHSDLVESNMRSAGFNVFPVDRVNFPKREGLNGPYRYHTGAVLYYDPSRSSYLDPRQNRHINLAEANEIMGVNIMFEDQNRSDSEFAVFFDDRNAALAAYRAAQDAGIRAGEVTYDSTVDRRYGVGRYAVRVAPHVRFTKSEQFLDFMESLYDHIEESDLDQFEWLLSETQDFISRGGRRSSLTERKGGVGGGGNAEFGGIPAGRIHRGNPLHRSADGEFGSKRQLPMGSYAYDNEQLKARKEKTKDGRLQFVATKLPCGRKARKKNVSQADKYRRCWDGQIPAWAKR